VTLAYAFLAAFLQVQDSATLRLQVVHDERPVTGAVVRASGSAAQTDDRGGARLRLVAGTHQVIVSRLGFATDSLRVTLFAGQDTVVIVGLREAAATVEAIVVTATRTERRLEDTPLRVEVVDEEEVEEKTMMTPGDITMLLNETSGLRVATTAPSLGGATVRIQGMRGRYTLILTDGLPLAGAPGSFGLLQIPPIDLARMEVIKGSASALYGPSALAGVVNLISRRPVDSAQHNLLLNHTSRLGYDGAYHGGSRVGSSPFGATVLVSAHRQIMTDVNADGWSDLPDYVRHTIRPRLFYDAPGRAVLLTTGYLVEDRTGGTMNGGVAPNGMVHEDYVNTARNDVGAVGRFALPGSSVLTFRASGTKLRHDHRYAFVERDHHHNAFAEGSVALPRGKATWVGGTALEASWYSNERHPGFDFDHRVASAFGQVDVDPAQWLAFSGSARADAHNVYGTTVNPRLSALMRRGESSARLSVGTGTFAPTALTEETEAIGLGFHSVPRALRAERAMTASMDLTHVVASMEINVTAFGSRLREPLAFVDTGSAVELVNAPSPVRTWGLEGLARWSPIDGIRVTGAGTHTRATEWDPGADPSARREVPLTPRNTASLEASWEGEWGRVGGELYYTGVQSLEDNPFRDRSAAYTMYGFLVERRLRMRRGQLRVFLNAENLGDVRQSKYQPLVRPTPGPAGRWSTDAWTDLVGRTLNGGLRVVF
jgi:outer membrane receptor for ferrienterochelin and colicins